jgi:hypothetical protein
LINLSGVQENSGALKEGKFFFLPLHLILYLYKQNNIPIIPLLLFDFTPTFTNQKNKKNEFGKGKPEHPN